MGAIKQLAGETVIYGGSTILGRMLNYLLVILYTRIFLPSDYGVVTELMSYAGFFNVIYLYGMETAFFRFASKGDTQKYFNICFTLVSSSSLILSSILVAFATTIVKSLNYDGHEIWIYMMSGIFFIDALAAIPFAKLRLERKAFKFAGVKFLGIIITIVLNLIFLLLIPKSLNEGALSSIQSVFESIPLVSYIFLANLLANTLMLLLLYSEIKTVSFETDREISKKLFKYALPILIIGLAGMTNDRFSTLILKHLLPDGIHGSFTQQEALGIFGACTKLAIFMTLAVQAFRFAFEPFFFSKSEDKNSPLLFSRVMTMFVIFGSLIVYFIGVNVHWIAPIFLQNQDYLTGLEVVPVLLVANLFLGIYYSLSVWYKLTDKTIFGAYISVGGGIITILFNVLLIPKYGYMGSAYTTLFTYGIMSALSYMLGKKHFPIPYELSKLMAYLVLAIILTYLVNILFDESLAHTFIRNIIGIIFFGGIILFFEIKKITPLLKKKD